MATVERSHPSYAGQSIYTRTFLPFYDAVVYGFNCPFLWRCPKARFLRHYEENLSARHLDVGVASGALLVDCRFPVPEPELTLMDLNPNSLAFAERRLVRYSPRTHQADALRPWGLGSGTFDSVGMTNLLHCLPGSIREKAVALEHAREAVAADGVVFGATILGRDVELNPPARLARAAANRRGAMSNLEDDLEGLEAALARTFPTYSTQQVGAVAIFTASPA